LFNAFLQRLSSHGARRVTIITVLTFLPALLGMAGTAAPGGRVSTLVVQDEMIMRVPVRPPPGRLQWIEQQGPRCILARAIRGAVQSGPDHVDFVTVRKRRFRAEFEEDCPAIDFYEGLYIKPEDHRVCAGRDVIRSRMGGSCRIERFRELVPKPRR
jgi:hypothetical protein